MNQKSIILLVFLLIISLSLSGCTLLQIPLAIIQGTFGLLSQLLKIANGLPKPPPWVFL